MGGHVGKHLNGGHPRVKYCHFLPGVDRVGAEFICGEKIGGSKLYSSRAEEATCPGCVAKISHKVIARHVEKRFGRRLGSCG